MLKSAFEIAMERSGGRKEASLTPHQKETLAAIDAKYDAQIAEREILFEQRHRAVGDSSEADALRTEFLAERETLNDRREREKQKIRQEK